MASRNKAGIRRWLKGLMLRRMHRMITCKEFEDFVLDYLEGGLSDRQRATLEWHLRLCRECREYLAAYRRTVEIEQAAFASPDKAVPRDVPDDLIKAVLDARKR